MRTTQFFVLLAASFALVPAAAAQQGGNIDLQAFKPAMDSRGFITVNSSQLLGDKEISFGIVTNWAKNLLTLRDGSNTYVVSNVISPTLVGAFGVKIKTIAVELGLSLPFQIMSGDRAPDSDNMTPNNPNDDANYQFEGQGIGDMGLHLKARLLNSSHGSKLGIALIASLYLPTTSAPGKWLGDGAFTPQLMAVVDKAFGRAGLVKLAINGGVRLRSDDHEFVDSGAGVSQLMPVTNQRINVGTTVPFGAGISYALAPNKFEVVGEVLGAIGLSSENYQPLEAIAGVKVYLARNSFLTLGGGVGFVPDMGGNPDVRAFMGIVFEPRIGDRDHDGINDDVDRCPDKPEDFDQFEDSDGCPDLDNDYDGIVDVDDKCPNEPENKNGFEDEDGCPETSDMDRDGDGILDKHDGCPDDREDNDGFKDTDGCPDNDNDNDKILDVDDLCPNKPENYNRNEDEDGCPDPDISTRVEGGIKVLKKIYFDFDSAVIQRRSHHVLDAVARTIVDNPDIRLLEVQGHTDSRGSRAYNLRLSRARAASVRRYLIDKRVAGSRLTAKGYGESVAIDPARTTKAYTTNRRVEFVILKAD